MQVEMRRYRLTLEYDGTDFHGWQRQPRVRTVQGCIEEALGRIAGRAVKTYGAGRTDAGVHATGQVCHFDCAVKMGVDKFERAVACNLPPDIVLRSLEEANADFHARFSAVARKYSYFVRTTPTALYRRFFHCINFSPDVAAMLEAAGLLLGEHDFSSFCNAKEEDLPPVCTLQRFEIRASGPVISFHLEANRFYYRMVRTLVGTLLEIGQGRIPPERIVEILGKRERRAAGPTLPPNGLFLTEVVYPG